MHMFLKIFQNIISICFITNIYPLLERTVTTRTLHCITSGAAGRSTQHNADCQLALMLTINKQTVYKEKKLF